MKCPNGLEPFDGGSLVVDGIDVGMPDADLTKLRERIGMVFQHFELYPHLTVLENICFAQVRVRRRSRREAETKARTLLTRVGLPDKEQAYPAQLPVARNSVSPLRRRSPWIRLLCFSMNRHRRSIRK